MLFNLVCQTSAFVLFESFHYSFHVKGILILVTLSSLDDVRLKDQNRPKGKGKMKSNALSNSPGSFVFFFYLEHLCVIDLLSLIFDENINPQPHRHRKETFGYQ